MHDGTTHAQRSRNARRYAVNEGFFDQIDTEAKAYWLGFITADGCVKSGRRDGRPDTVKIALGRKDREHLAAFREAVGSEHPIRDGEHESYGRVREHSEIAITSVRLADALIDLGVTPRKSLTVRPCPAVSSDLARHYWRGLIDGDGWIRHDRKRHQHILGLGGSKAIVRAFHAFLIGGGVRTKIQPKPYKSIWVLAICGRKVVQTAGALLWKNAQIVLCRKHVRYLEIAKIKPPGRFNWLTQDELDQRKATLKTWRAVAESLGTSRESLVLVRKRIARQVAETLR